RSRSGAWPSACSSSPLSVPYKLGAVSTPHRTPWASSSARYSSAVTSRAGAEWRWRTSGASTRMTWAWQSTAPAGKPAGAGAARRSAMVRLDHGRSRAAAILGEFLRGRQEAFLQLLDLRHAHDAVQGLERNQQIRTVDHRAG